MKLNRKKKEITDKFQSNFSYGGLEEHLKEVKNSLETVGTKPKYVNDTLLFIQGQLELSFKIREEISVKGKIKHLVKRDVCH